MCKLQLDFANTYDKIWIPVTKVLLHAAIGDLDILKEQREWLPLNAVLLPPFLTEAAVLDNKTAVANLLKVFVK